jgi:hypothetical protein
MVHYGMKLEFMLNVALFVDVNGNKLVISSNLYAAISIVPGYRQEVSQVDFA